jgi:methylmalonyl-CoA mutase
VIEKDLDLAADFPPTTYEAWRAEVESELKGAPFDKKLVGRTYEGIDIQPLYTARDWPSDGDPAGFPGFLPLTRGREALGHALAGWDVHQDHVHPDPAETNRAILDDLEHGVTSIGLRLDAAASAGLDADARGSAGLCGQDGVMVYSVGDLDRLLDGVRLDVAPVALDAGGAFLPAAALLAALLEGRRVDPASVRVAFDADPLGSLMRDGRLGVPLDAALAQMADLAAWTAARYPHATAVAVDTGPYHHASASSTQDLAFAVGTALEYLRAMTRAGLDIETAARQIVFEVSLGCEFFRATAKLRALRMVWSKVVVECGGTEAAARATRVRSRTSRRVLTSLDPWINLLRNTVCCFAGAVGGADSITTAPLDAAIGLSDEFSRHLARNTQTILREESFLGRVVDPAGGSWFLETLTGQLAEKAWGIFRQVEECGGMVRAAVSGWVAERIEEVEAARRKDLATRKRVVTGVSEHPDPREERLSRPQPDPTALRASAISRLSAWRRDKKCDDALAALSRAAAALPAPAGGLTTAAVAAARAGATLGQISAALTAAGAEAERVRPLAVRTYAAAYEELRAVCDRFAAQTGRRPRVYLVNLGAPADYIARETYALNFFQAGGFEVIDGEGTTDPQAAAAAFARSGAPVAVICSTDKIYETLVGQLAPRLKATGARSVILAGNPGANDSAFRAAGVNRFIFIRCNVLGTLRDLLREEGVLP